MLAPLRRVWPAARRGQRAKSMLVRTVPPKVKLGFNGWRAEKRPLVALESTIISHGLPWPLNLETARACEAAVRDAGAEPATIALFDGRVHIGLTAAKLERLARCAREDNEEKATKTGERDIAAVLASGGVGGTTVSATLHLARWAGIEFFATGGIGGVHRGAETSFDISSDLTALARGQGTSVFCSGVKSILAIEQTLEYLETMAVNVMSFNPSGEFPAFYSARSGFFVPSVDGPVRAARIILRSLEVRQPGANLFAVPIPQQYEAAGEAIARAVEQAVAESVANGMAKRGKEVTPWLLKRVGELSSSSKESNVALVVNNARVAAQTAVKLHELRARKAPAAWSSRPTNVLFGASGHGFVHAADADEVERGLTDPDVEGEFESELGPGSAELVASENSDSDWTEVDPERLAEEQQAAEQPAEEPFDDRPAPPVFDFYADESPLPEIVVFGGAALDFTARAYPSEAETLDAFDPSQFGTSLGERPTLGDTLPGRMWVNAGGVARNVAEAAARLTPNLDAVLLVAPVADDQQGEMLEDAIEDADMRTDGLFVVPDASTATATMMLSSDGSLMRGIIDMDITEKHIQPSTVQEALARTLEESSKLVVALDCNVPVSALRAALEKLSGLSVPVLVEPTSVVKSRRLISAIAPGAAKDPQDRLIVAICTPTMDELRAMFRAACDEGLVSAADAEAATSDANPAGPMALQLSRLLGNCTMLVKDGANGVLSVRHLDTHSEILHHPAPVLPPDSIVSSSGAGDTFAGCMLALSNASLRLCGVHPCAWTQAHLSEAIAISQDAACLSLACKDTISPQLDVLWPRFDVFMKEHQRPPTVPGAPRRAELSRLQSLRAKARSKGQPKRTKRRVSRRRTAAERVADALRRATARMTREQKN